MLNDPIVEEVREVRRRHAERFNFDLRAIAEDLMKKQERHSDRLVSLLPKKPRKHALRS